MMLNDPRAATLRRASPCGKGELVAALWMPDFRGFSAQMSPVALLTWQRHRLTFSSHKLSNWRQQTETTCGATENTASTIVADDGRHTPAPCKRRCSRLATDPRYRSPRRQLPLLQPSAVQPFLRHL